MQNAITKINNEMDSSKSHPYIQIIGDFLIRHIETNPHDAEKILAEGKTIAKSLEAMQSEARKKQHNGMAMLTDAEGFAIVLKYFGIEGGTVSAAAAPAPPVFQAGTASDFDVKLEDLL